MKSVFLRFLCLLVLLTTSSAAGAEIRLNFGAYTSNKPTAIVKKFRPVLKAIERRVSAELNEPVKIHMQIAKSYEQGLADLIEGKVDFARFGSASYVAAKQKAPDIEILAIESNNGKKTFRGIICVAEDSPITRIADLRNTRFAFGSERSTIGRYLSQSHLLRHEIHAADLAGFEYLGRHDLVGKAVAMGKFDAGALNENTFNKLVKKGNKLRVLAEFPVLTKPWIARGGLPPRHLQALRRALLEMDDQKALGSLGKSGFLQASDQDFRALRQVMSRAAEFF